MAIYTITEKQNSNSTRYIYTVECESLTSAKRLASKRQSVHGSVISIEDNNGHTVAAKERSGKWIENSRFN